MTEREPATAWDAVLDTGTAEELFALACDAYRRGLTDVAERAAGRAAEAGHAEAMYERGLMLAQRGDHAGAERWLRHAADAGHLKAMHNLGATLIKLGRDVEGELWLRRGAEAGDPDGMYNLGIHSVLGGDPVEGHRWLRAALEAGRADAAQPLHLLVDVTDQWNAAAWLRHAGFTTLPRLHTSDNAAIRYLIDNPAQHRDVLRHVYATGHCGQIVCAHLLVAAGIRTRHHVTPPVTPPCVRTLADYPKLVGSHRADAIAHGLAAALLASLTTSELLPDTVTQLGHALPHWAVAVAASEMFAFVAERVEVGGDIPFARLVQRLPEPSAGLDEVLSDLLTAALAGVSNVRCN